MSFIDRLFPSRARVFRAAAQAGLKRGLAAARDVRFSNSAYYPSAEVGGYRAEWIPQLCSSTSLLRGSYSVLASRSEHAWRTDPYARRAVDILRTFVVGSGLRPFPAVKYANGEPIEGLNAQLSRDWERFNDQAYRVGSQKITALEAQGIEFNTMVTLGSWLRQVVAAENNNLLPYAFTIVKPTRLDFSHDNYFDDSFRLNTGTPFTVLGQIMDKYMNPSAFWIDNERTVRSAENMSIHYRMIEAEQYLGIPWLVVSLGHIWDIQKLFEDKLTQSRILSRMGVWEKKENKKAMAKLLETDEDGEDGIPFEKSQIYYADSEPKPIQFDDTIGESFSPLVKMSLHAIAVGAGFSYGRLTTDLEGANFAGGRINLITDSKIFNAMYKQFYKCSCQSMWNKFVDWEFLMNRIPAATYAQYKADPWYYSQCYWLPEAEQWVDPLKDAQAQDLLYKTGQITLQQLCASRGENYKSIIRQRAKEKQELTEAGLGELLPVAENQKTAIDTTDEEV
jgi:lambda family phage portal protein